MDDSHPDLHTFRGNPATFKPSAPNPVAPNPVALNLAASRRAQATRQRPSGFVQTLREARRNSGLELDDLAETTHIRFFYLEALEAGRLAELPSDAPGKDLVRRYAQAVGLDPARVLIMYAQERRSLRPQTELVRLELPVPDYTSAPRPRFGRFARLAGSLLLVAGAIWLALRVFDTTLVPGTTGAGVLQMPRSVTDPTPVPLETARTAPATPARPTAASATTPAAPAMILLSLQTTPPGAEVSIDGYRFGQSPIIDAPVRAGNRTIRVARGGYGTFERTLDLGRDRRLDVTLFRKGAGEPTVTGAAPAQAQTPVTSPTTANPASTVASNTASSTTPNVAAAQPAPAAATQVVVTVSSQAWLEVYRGGVRSGERLVYQTAEPGDTFSFSGPIYVFSGNAGGISVAEGNASAEPLGMFGAVVGNAY